jgi:large subunit ribosomal protein L10
VALRLEGKKAIVAEVAKIASSALSAVAAEYRGLTVSQMTKLRANARSNGVYMRVVRNTLARRAVADTDFACMQEAFVGPLLLAFSQEEPGSAARLVRDFAKEHDKLVVKALAVGGQLLAPSDLDKLATLPTRPEAISQLMSVMLAPITQLVQTMAAPHAKLVRTVAAIRDQKAQAS